MKLGGWVAIFEFERFLMLLLFHFTRVLHGHRMCDYSTNENKLFISETPSGDRQPEHHISLMLIFKCKYFVCFAGASRPSYRIFA